MSSVCFPVLRASVEPAVVDAGWMEINQITRYTPSSLCSNRLISALCLSLNETYPSLPDIACVCICVCLTYSMYQTMGSMIKTLVLSPSLSLSLSLSRSRSRPSPSPSPSPGAGQRFNLQFLLSIKDSSYLRHRICSLRGKLKQPNQPVN